MAFGLTLGAVTVLLHSGSRGLGYQVCDDSLGAMRDASRRYRIVLPDPPARRSADHFARGPTLPRGNARGGKTSPGRIARSCRP